MDPATAMVAGGLDAQALGAITVAVCTLTQLMKTMGFPPQRAPLAVLGISALGVGLWCFAHDFYGRKALFDIFSAWIVVSTASAGVWSFIRSGPAALTATKDPPPSAMSAPTQQASDPISDVALSK